MKITKYIHSCLLVQDQNKTFLFDPGLFTYNAKVIDLATLTSLDYILITHEHADHFHLPFVKELVGKFPSVKIISNASVVSQLQKEHITASAIGDMYVHLESAPHEKLWDKEVPPHVVINILDKLTHAGDSLSFIKSNEVLALPIQAPWGSTREAVEKALSVNPKVIIPIHDWHWKEDIRMGMYDRLEEFFATKGIEFKKAETGVTLEIKTTY